MVAWVILMEWRRFWAHRVEWANLGILDAIVAVVSRMLGRNSNATLRLDCVSTGGFSFGFIGLCMVSGLVLWAVGIISPAASACTHSG